MLLGAYVGLLSRPYWLQCRSNTITIPAKYGITWHLPSISCVEIKCSISIAFEITL